MPTGFQFLTVTPTGDIFQDFYNKFDNNTNQSIDAMTLTVNALTLTRVNGSTLTVDLPIVPNRIVTGMVSSSVGFNLSITAGTYQINNASFNIGAGAFVIPAAHPTLNRIDILVADDSLPAPAGTYLYLTGTAAVNPVPPAVASNQVLVTAINVPAASVPNLGNGFYLLPQGTLNGQTLRWNAGTMEWLTSDAILNTDAVVNITPTSNFNVAAGTFPNNSYINSNSGQNKFGIQLGASAFSEMNFDASGISIVSNGVGSGAVVFDVEQGIQINSYTPSIVTDKLYQIGGVLYWSGDAICLAPCGGGGGNVDDGTVDFTTLRWDNGLLQWVENQFNKARDNRWNLICNSFLTATLPSANNATGIMFNIGTTFGISSNASFIAGCLDNNQITHADPTITYGANSIVNSNLGTINLDPNYLGLCSVEQSVNCQITDTNPVAAGFGGKSFIKGSITCNINDAINQNSITTSLNSDIQYATLSTIFGCNNTNVGLTGTTLTNICGAFGCDGSSLFSTVQSCNSSVVIGTKNGLLDGTEASGLFSGSGNSITALLTGGSFQNVVIGGTNNTITVDANNVSNGFVIGGQLNTIDSTLGTIQDSGLVGCYNTTVNDTAYRCVGIGLNGATITRNDTVAVSSLDSRGARLKKVRNHTGNSTTVQTDDHVIDCQTVNLYATQTTNLPASPEDGREVIVINSDGTCTGVNTVTINGNGKNINGAATQIITTSYFYKVLIFVANTNQWVMS